MQLIDEDLVRRGRTLVVIALVATGVAFPAIFRGWTAVLMVCLLASWLAGFSGMRDVARGSDGSPLAMYPSLVLAFMPGMNLAPLLYYLHRAQSALKLEPVPPEALAAALPRRPVAPDAAPVEPAVAPPRGTARPAAPKAPAAPAAPRKSVLSSAVACVKVAGFENVPEGERLQVPVESLPGAAAADEPLVRAAHGVFGVFYLLDMGGHYAYANKGQLEATGGSLDALHRIAVANLARKASVKPGVQLVPQPGFHGLTLDGQLEASLVLVDALWDGTLREYIPNGAVVAIPSRDVCAFCDAGSAEGIAQLRQVVERVTRGGDHLLCDKLFLRKDKRWSLFAAAKPADLPPLEFNA